MFNPSLVSDLLLAIYRLFTDTDMIYIVYCFIAVAIIGIFRTLIMYRK